MKPADGPHHGIKGVNDGQKDCDRKTEEVRGNKQAMPALSRALVAILRAAVRGKAHEDLAGDEQGCDVADKPGGGGMLCNQRLVRDVKRIRGLYVWDPPTVWHKRPAGSGEPVPQGVDNGPEMPGSEHDERREERGDSTLWVEAAKSEARSDVGELVRRRKIEAAEEPDAGDQKTRGQCHTVKPAIEVAVGLAGG